MCRRAQTLADILDRGYGIEFPFPDTTENIADSGRKLIDDIVTDGLSVGDKIGNLQTENYPAKHFRSGQYSYRTVLYYSCLAGQPSSRVSEFIGYEGFFNITSFRQVVHPFLHINKTTLANTTSATYVTDMAFVLLGYVKEYVSRLCFTWHVIDVDTHGSGYLLFFFLASG